MYPVTFRNVLEPKKFLSLNQEFEEGWCLNNSSGLDGDNVTWGFKDPSDTLIFYDVATIIKLKIQKVIKRPLKFFVMNVNGQTTGQGNLIHTDFECPWVWSFVLFTHMDWDIQWGGEFVCTDPNTKEHKYVPCLSNTGVLIPAHWEHYGQSPNVFTSRLRTSLRFSYCDDDKWELFNAN